MVVPNILGYSILNKSQVANKIRKAQVPIGILNIPRARIPIKGKITKRSVFVQDVDMLQAANDKAFLYDSGKVDIMKDGEIRTVKFRTKKDASLYLMKAGWQYV